ncbi:LacI family DNA-binding transcriptional regulator [Spongiactinospora sp. TRM90649]|uniref:LacI family DNA-binding transcriptional regulator n=1 Tax=Spongiactinospora sp. TRM90649 TaxID=3031114 RepID=UPI0023F8529D|nr:LacI family DNA-binding transcriptional regulator [Spongiactinospora sp. TRM90649]MDF5752939.1 LacI family DNA-binding transcriptional regulator [Spongiactinospora sp. TRM90649]
MPPRPRHPADVGPTGFDVARLAGVTQPTVSRALRNAPGVSPETRERVLAAARELSYIPSDRGRALVTRTTRRVAIVAGELTNPFYPELVEPLRAALEVNGYRCVVVADDAGSASLPALADGSYDGVILTTTPRRSTLPRDLTERGVPHVLLNRVLDHAESPSCGVDNRLGATQVADLVVDLGHTVVGMLNGPVATSTGRERAQALRARLRQRGIAVRRDLARQVPFAHDEAEAEAVELLRRRDRPTALVCGNDVIALGALSAARRLGLGVPADLSVIGFDDIGMASRPMIDLTTVRTDLAAMADLGATMLLAAIGGEVTPVERTITPALVLRGTHAPPSTPR